MITVNILAGLFSAGQIAGIVILSVLIAALIAINVYIAYLLRKRGEHKLHTVQLQQQRMALLEKLNALRYGVPVEELPDDDDEDEEEEIAAAEAESDGEETLVVADEDGDEESVDVEVDEKGAVVRYNRSFTARITQANDEIKQRYSELKNHLLSYVKVRSRISWRREIFRIGNRTVASFVMRGKTLCLCLATDPVIFADTKYAVEDLSARSKRNTTPCMYRVKSKRKTAYAKELIDIVLAGFNAERNTLYTQKDFIMPYQSTYVLIKRRLIKVIGEVDELEKEEAMAAFRGIRYVRSFEARIIQSDAEVKARYSKLKNYILAYEKVGAQRSWKHESFRYKKGSIALLLVRGKTLCLCLAGNPEAFEGTKYAVEDLSLRNKTTTTPILYRVKSNRRLNYAMQLIDIVFGQIGVVKGEREEVDYTAPFETTNALIDAGLIKVVEIKRKVVPAVSATAESGGGAAQSEAAATDGTAK